MQLQEEKTSRRISRLLLDLRALYWGSMGVRPHTLAAALEALAGLLDSSWVAFSIVVENRNSSNNSNLVSNPVAVS